MKTISFTINAKTVESYLYGGYLFMLLEDGRILYVSYHRLIHMLCERYPQFAKLLELAFLHNEYLKSKGVQLVLGIEEIQETIRKLWEKANREIQFEIDLSSIEPYCTIMGKWKDFPLDVCMYDLRMYVASRSGMMESRLNPDFSANRYPLYPTKFEKCFDSKVISINARAGKVVLSADREGLFYADALVSDSRVSINDKNHVSCRSLRTGWSGFDIINYESSSDFHYLTNETIDVKNTSNNRFRFGDKIERKEITGFATSSFDMDEMMTAKTGIKKEDICYSFNSQERSFFMLNNGSFVNVKINKLENEPIQYSSFTKALPTIKGLGKQKPLKAAIVPNGCVVEFFNKVILYQKGAAHVLEEAPSFNIRTYMGSKNYRDIVTITKENAVSFHSVDVFDTISSQRIFPNRTNLS